MDEETSDEEEDIAHPPPEMDMSIQEDDGYCLLCGRSTENGEWFGCDYCRKWQHSNCMSLRHRAEARKSVGKSLQGRITGHLCCVICFHGNGVTETEDRGDWVQCHGGGECSLTCHAQCLPSPENWTCHFCLKSV